MLHTHVAFVTLIWAAGCATGFAQEATKNIVLIAGLKSHGPEGNGIHDYAWSARLIKSTLENSNIRDHVEVTMYLTGWPSDEAALEDADTIMIISDGRDGDIGREAPHLAGTDRVRQVERLTERGCGIITFHFSTFAPDALGDKALDWYGGYFDWQSDGKREWYSDITTIEAVVSPAAESHAVLRGVKPFKMREEFYYDIRFRDGDDHWTPIWTVDDLPATKPQGKTVAWAVQRGCGSRGFATTCGHFYENWQNAGFRKTILNAIAWTAHVDVPELGVLAPFYSREQIARHLQQPDSIAKSSALSQSDEEAYADEPYWYQPGHPLIPAEARSITTLPGFSLEKVYTVPKEMGSWTAITTDVQGRLICAAQHKPGLYRLTISEARDEAAVRVEKLQGVAQDVGWSHGLLYAFDSLYVTVSEGNDSTEGGVYRLRDTDGDDQYDKITQLFELNAAGEHGPHNIVVGPDGNSLYIMCGNATRMPDAIERRFPSSTEGTDHLMPPGFDSSEYMPAGFVLRFDPDGQNRQLMCGGLRNSFDLAFNNRGDLFTFDSDMEWDLGTPWYRATRICHLVPGGEFGWRGDAAKWPAYFEDSNPPVINVGPASPSGIVFGYGAKFPSKYQHALYACDWTFATIHSVHLQPYGASYRATIEEFVGGNGLPVTDLVIGTDGAMYFLVGGRRLGSALFRVKYVGDEPTAPRLPPPMDEATQDIHTVRRQLGRLHGIHDEQAVDAAMPFLGHADRAIRFAARVALESQPVVAWRERVTDTTTGMARLVGLLALARKDEPSRVPAVVDQLNGFDVSALDAVSTLTMLRAYELALARGGDEIGALQRNALSSRLQLLFPHVDSRVNRELVRLLCYLQSADTIDSMLRFMTADQGERPTLRSGYFVRNPKYGQAVHDILQSAPLLDRMHTAQMLLWIDDGWSKEQRQKYFELIADAEAHSQGGHWYREFWERIREVALDQTPREWRKEMEAISATRTVADYSELPVPAGPGEEWTLSELLEVVESDFRQRDFANGKKMFAAAKCITCHRFNGEGNATGPDLSSIGQRFTLRDILDATLHPSKAISDQYRVTMLVTVDGRTISGLVVSRDHEKLTIAINLNRPSQTATIPIANIDAEYPTPVSTMPDGLLNPLNRDEILDLLAYLISGANDSHPVFAN